MLFFSQLEMEGLSQIAVIFLMGNKQGISVVLHVLQHKFLGHSGWRMKSLELEVCKGSSKATKSGKISARESLVRQVSHAH